MRKRILRELSEDQGFVENGRRFVNIPMDAAVTYRWKFVEVNTPEAAENEPNCIRLVYSNNPHDLPVVLMRSFTLLYDGVFHCLPHNQTFSEPIILSFTLPQPTDSSRITVMYSNTDVGRTTDWKILDNPEYSQASESLHNRESGSFQNRAILLGDGRELQLILTHFCVFAILVDGRKEHAQIMTVDTYLNIADSSYEYKIIVLVVLGCNVDKCVSI